MIDNDDPSCLPGQTFPGKRNIDTKRDLCPRVSKSSGKQSWKVVGKQAGNGRGLYSTRVRSIGLPPLEEGSKWIQYDALGDGIVFVVEGINIGESSSPKYLERFIGLVPFARRLVLGG